MSLTFVEHHTANLVAGLTVTTSTHSVSSAGFEHLRSLYLSLKHPLSPSQIRKALECLACYGPPSPSSPVHKEEDELKRLLVCNIVVGLYTEVLKIHLSEASEAEVEAEWWADVGRSRWNVAWYLLQSLPSRLLNLFYTILKTIRSQKIPLRPSVFTPSSLRLLFPSPNTLRPHVLTVSLFPHLVRQPHSLPPFSASTSFERVLGMLKLPIELTRQECRFKQKQLTTIRDERAKTLGELAASRDSLARVLSQVQHFGSLNDHIGWFVSQLHTVTLTGTEPSVDRVDVNDQDILASLELLATTSIPRHKSTHRSQLSTLNLLRPSRLTLLWPKLVLLPPTLLYLVKKLYASRATVSEIALDGVETARAFVRSWILEPMREVIQTIRAGGEEGVIIRKEGIVADFDSLERMTLALAKDKLHYTPEQLAYLSQQIRLGDLTPVLQIYEEDIKRPLKSVMTGTLLRSVFVQVQKAKVDIDQALSGIDKLLKSQELTFAFVGVAPAFAVVYLVGGYVQRMWNEVSGRGRYGGRKKRADVWLVMRRVERLLTSRASEKSTSISSLTAGLLLLSLMRLRQYAEDSLPRHSTLKEGLLEDIEDLEDPGVGRDVKLKVVERMWRCWGDELGWGGARRDAP